MNHTYNLFNPLDYVRIVFLAFFNQAGFGVPEERRQEIILEVQGILIILTVNAVAGWLAISSGDWDSFAFGIIVSVVVGVLLCLVDEVGGGVAFGVAIGVAVGAVGSTIGNAALGVALGGAIVAALALGAGMEEGLLFNAAIYTSIVAAVGVSSGVAAGVKELLDGTWGWVAGLGIATVGTIIAGVLLFFLAFAVGMIWEGVFGTSSVTRDLWSSLVLLALLSVGTGYLFKLFGTWIPALRGTHPLWIAATLFLIQTRLPLWPLEIAIGLCGYALGLHRQGEPAALFQFIRNAYFDRYMWLPLPGEGKALGRLVEMDWNNSIKRSVEIARTSNHILAAAKTLHFLARTDPYSVQAYIGASDGLAEYTFHNQEGAVDQAHIAYQTLRRLGERLAPEQFASEQEVEQPHLTLLARLQRVWEPPTEDEEALSAQDVVVELHEAVEAMREAHLLAGKAHICYAEEMIALYAGLEAALGWSEVHLIATFHHVSSLPTEDAPHLFSTAVVETLAELDEIAKTVAAFNEATSQVTKGRYLLAANEQLVSLGERMEEQVQSSPRADGSLLALVILALVIIRWQRLLATSGGELARVRSVEPVANPYVIANPVVGNLFAGREDIMRRLEELWSGTEQRPSIVLYGHRRMGKSSILHNLGARFGAQTTIVDFSIQRQGRVSSTGELLHNLALALYDAQIAETPGVLEEWDEPDEERFTAHNPYTAFNRFLKRLDQVRAERCFIITMDEFELIEEYITEGTLEPHLLGFCRGVIHTYSWLVIVFAGLHRLEEKRHEYWNPLFGSVTAIPVSFLSDSAARQLITQPTPDFPLDYDHDAVERIIEITHGQPYLVQLMCHGLVTRFNRQTFEKGIEREQCFSLTDVEAIINAPEFYRDGNAYFTGVWQQAETSKPHGQTAVLRAMAHFSPVSQEGLERGQTAEEIARQAGLTPEDVGGALETLVRHDVVIEKDGHWQFAVELMRRWVVQTKGGQ